MVDNYSKQILLRNLKNDLSDKKITLSNGAIGDLSKIKHIKECSLECNKFAKTMDKENCKKKCKSLTMGFNFPIFYSSSVPRTSKGSEFKKQVDILDQNIIQTLITGNNSQKVLGKNYAKPMDLELKIPLSKEYVNANCRDAKTKQKKRRYMYIRGIPRGNIAKGSIILPNEPIDWRTGWTALFSKMDSGNDAVKGRKRLEEILKELKNRCFTFLYDVQINAAGVWAPVDKLTIPGDCLKHLKNITKDSEFSILKNYTPSNLKGLIPSIVEDVVDMNPISLLEKSGIADNNYNEDTCLTISENLGEARYSNPDLKQYKFEVYTNFNENDRFKIICMLIVVIVLFLNLIYNIE